MSVSPKRTDAGRGPFLSGWAWRWGLSASLPSGNKKVIEAVSGDWFQAIGRFLGLAVLAVLVSACGTGKGRLPPVVVGAEVTPLLQTARSQLGARYHPGGTLPATGFDCSGFTQWVYRQHGLLLPRQSFDQYQAGQPVGADQLQPGDLVFFEIEKKGASHVGIYEARGWFIHCSSPGGRVREDHLSERYWQQHYLGACRPDPRRASGPDPADRSVYFLLGGSFGVNL